MTSIKIKLHELSAIASACYPEATKFAPIERIIPSYRKNPEQIKTGEKFTALFCALGVSQVTLSFKKTIDEPLLFMLPQNVESLSIEIHN